MAGDIGALVKLKNTFTGNTLCDRSIRSRSSRSISRSR